MTANRLQTESMPATTGEVRLCDRCGRPLPAVHKNEYTPQRARLVTATGFCVCPSSTDGGGPRIPDRAPSLL